MLDTQTRAHIFNANIKSDLGFCLPVWGTHGSAQVTAMNRLLLRAKRIITRNKSKSVDNKDFYLYSRADFTCIVFYAIVRHFHYFVNSSDCTFMTLQQVSQSIPTRAFVANKCLIAISTHACDDSFCF